MSVSKPLYKLIKLFSLSLVLCPAVVLFAQPINKDLQTALNKVNQTVAVYAIDKNGEILAAINPDLPLKPASILKLVTTSAALNILGRDFKFSTAVYYQESSNTLIFKGFGDPSLTIERLDLLVRELKARGISNIARLILDESAFLSKRKASSRRAYATGSSALSFNFNSLGVRICPPILTTVKGAIITPEPLEAPIRIINEVQLVNGKQQKVTIAFSQNADLVRITGQLGRGADCLLKYASVEDPLAYFSAVLSKVLKDNGITVKKIENLSLSTENFKLLFVFWGVDLNTIAQQLNYYSNNFIAEQLVNALGRMGDGTGQFFDRQAGLEALMGELASIGMLEKEIKLYDGSGLSHDNKITARAIGALLRNVSNNNKIGAEFIASLPVAGVTSTLKTRIGRLSDEVVVRAKTGTLDGVSSLAGIIMSGKGKPDIYFAIIQNGVKSKEQAVKLEDEIVRILARKV